MIHQYFLGFLLVAFLCGTFTPANGLTCYKCAWSEACGSTKPEATVECGAAADGDATAAADATTAAAAQARLLRESNENRRPSFSKFQQLDGATHFCFSVEVKKNGKSLYERGCKDNDKKDDCVVIDAAANPKATAGTCTVCDKDKCNGASVTVMSVPCALLSAMLVARIMFFQAK